MIIDETTIDGFKIEVTNETKTFPEEDFEYKGKINGEEWEAKVTYGHHPGIYILDGDLSSDEETALREGLAELYY